MDNSITEEIWAESVQGLYNRLGRESRAETDNGTHGAKQIRSIMFRIEVVVEAAAEILDSENS